jgi:hypothetical protein
VTAQTLPFLGYAPRKVPALATAKRGERMPMDENIVTWNVTNWITVVLMVALGFVTLGWLQNLWASRQKAA